MGHSSKKKKKKGGGRSKGRASSKDHASLDGGDNELLSEEITALCAIFQEDCSVVSGPSSQIIIKLRPYSKDMGYEDLDVSALLIVRCLPGYPYKCPKLQITAEEGLSKSDAENLLSLLNDQANSNAREGRVMIFNLVEAAQEFLSEIVPVGQSRQSMLCSTTSSSSQLPEKDIAISSNKSCSLGSPFIYGFIDLFSGFGESWHWTLEMDDKRRMVSSVESHALHGSKPGYNVLESELERNPEPLTMDKIQVPSPSPVVKLDSLKEESDNDKSISTSDSSSSSMEDMIKNGMVGEKENFPLEDHSKEDHDEDLEGEPWETLSSSSLSHDQASETIEKDLMMVHLLRLACASKGPLSDNLQQIISELSGIGIFPEWVQDLASKPSSVFNKTFDHVFHQYTISSKVSQFWKPVTALEGPSASLPSSRYLNDFEELKSLGHGGFGHVVLCKNKLDGRQYAVKKIRLKDESLPINDRILR
ncbi:hypothetical protein SLEP1_g24305 [Rubroshorea leprosula]|nr:hypothetical protein SLEP1_g24305 [Rubroshorea leprosula]